MKFLIALLILFALSVVGYFWMQHELNRVADETPHTCAEWLMDSPQKGCEVSK